MMSPEERQAHEYKKRFPGLSFKDIAQVLFARARSKRTATVNVIDGALTDAAMYKRQRQRMLTSADSNITKTYTHASLPKVL